MENKIYTAEELRAESAELVDMLGEHSMTASMLRYAADVVNRCEDYIKTMKECGDNLYASLIEEICNKILYGIVAEGGAK